MSCNKLKGEFSKPISVTTNDPENPNIRLICAGQILEAMKFDTSRIDFGKASRTPTTRQKVVVVTRGDGGPLTPGVTPPKSKNLKAELREIEKGERYELVVTLVPPFAIDRVVETLKLQTGVPEAPGVTIRVVASVFPRLAVKPKRFSVPADPKPEWQQQVRLTWDDNQPYRILAATVDDPNLKVRIEDVNGRQRVLLRVAEGLKPTAGNHTVTVETDDPEMPTVEILVLFGAQRGSKASSRKPGPRTPKATRGVRRKSGTKTKNPAPAPVPVPVPVPVPAPQD